MTGDARTSRLGSRARRTCSSFVLALSCAGLTLSLVPAHGDQRVHDPRTTYASERADTRQTTMTFDQRCAQPGVVRCIGFDRPSDIAERRDGVSGITAGVSAPSLDTSVRASGASSIRFTIPSNSGSDTSGSYFTNFSDDLSVQFGENEEFYVQWRQRFSPELLATRYKGGGGWKLAIVSTGDQRAKRYYSCTAIGIVTQNYYQHGFPILYNSCTGSTSHGPYDGFYERIGNTDFKLQNARPAPGCLYTQQDSSFFPPTGNCFRLVANEWMTFQLRVQVGTRVNDEFVGSRVSLWMAREGRPSELVIDWGPYNLTAGKPSDHERYGKVWLLPYHTDKDPAQAHPVAYTWYDELIISRARIADPASGVSHAARGQRGHGELSAKAQGWRSAGVQTAR